MTNNVALIIEDDDLLSDIFSKSLEGLYSCEVIKDGNLALTRFAEAQPGLVLLDLHLPGMNGDKILEGIRSSSASARCHVILCTADARKAEILRDEADLVFLKPVNPLELRQIASRFLSNKE
jgi:CheY-like chemotaxis protein